MRKLLISMSLLSLLFGCGKSTTPAYPQDKITANDGSTITLTFFAHATLGIEHNGRHIYIDPVGDFKWNKLPKADAILITHSHYDHFELESVEKLQKEGKLFRSTKGDGHGFGLVRIDAIVERLEGYISRNSEDGAFTTEILLPQV